MKPKGSIGRVLGLSGLALGALITGTAGYLFWPVSALALRSHPNPVTSYDEAVRRISKIQREESGLNPVCTTQLLSHGKKTKRVYILVHGYTNCPAQYSAFAPSLYESGANVLVMRLPRHGLSNRMNEDQSRLTAQEISAYADQSVDIAQGLGEQVVMVGLSLGGVTTAWAAQHRSEIYRAVVISPAFGFKIIPANLTTAVMRAYMALPNSYTWWNPEIKDALTVMTYAYPRYSSRTLAQTLKLGQNVLAHARQHPLQAGSVLIVTNPNDEAVNMDMIAKLTSSWQKLAADKVSTYQFPAEPFLKHDLLDPNQEEIDVVTLAYPKLLELLTAP